jgi:hypothetical protein
VDILLNNVCFQAIYPQIESYFFLFFLFCLSITALMSFTGVAPLNSISLISFNCILHLAVCRGQFAFGKGQLAISSLQLAKKLCVNSAFSLLCGEIQLAEGKEQFAKLSA